MDGHRRCRRDGGDSWLRRRRDGDEGGDGGGGDGEGDGEGSGEGSSEGDDEGVLIDMAPTEDATTGGGEAGKVAGAGGTRVGDTGSRFNGAGSDTGGGAVCVV
jgi:hypothetical protein